MKLPQVQRDEIQTRQLRGERFRRCHADLGPRARVQDGVSNTGGHRAHDVGDRQRLPLVAHLPLSGNRIERLPGLRDENEKGVRQHDRVAIPVLARIIHFNRKPGQ